MSQSRKPSLLVYYSEAELQFLSRCAHDFAGPVSLLSVARKIYRDRVFGGRRSIHGVYRKLYEMAIREGYVDPVKTAFNRRR